MFILIFLFLMVVALAINLIVLCSSIATAPWLLLFWALIAFAIKRWWSAKSARQAPQRAAEAEFRQEVADMLAAGRDRSARATAAVAAKSLRHRVQNHHGCEILDLDDLDWYAEG